MAQPSRQRPRRTCHAFNHLICRRLSCNFLHLCEICWVGHSAWVHSNRDSSIFKPTTWTPLRLFIFEHELSNHPDQAFVKQLINDLCHGCFIGYKGPQFSYSTNNLVSAYQHPTTINIILEKECQLGCILGPSPVKFPDFGTGLYVQRWWWVENYLPFIYIAIHKY